MSADHVIPFLILISFQTTPTIPSSPATATTECKIRKRLIHSLYKQKKYSDAELVLTEWASSNNHHQDINKYIEKLKNLLKSAANSKSIMNTSSSSTTTSFNDDYEQIDTKLENLIINNLPPDKYSKQLSIIDGSVKTNNNQHNINNIDNNSSNSDNSNNNVTDPVHLLAGSNNTDSDKNSNPLQKSFEQIGNSGITCVYCTMVFNDRSELRAHCQTETHQNIIMSDEGEFYTNILITR